VPKGSPLRSRFAGALVVVPSCRALGHDHDHGGAQAEASHFLALGECSCLVAFVAGGCDLAIAWRNNARPYRLNTADDHGADQHQGHGPGFGVEDAGHSFVTGKQVWNVLGGNRID